MQIQRIVKGTHRRYRVDIEYRGMELTMPLYGTELKTYSIEEGAQLPDEVYERICDEILYKRAMDYTLYLLGAKSYTEKEIACKLIGAYYSEPVISRTISKLIEYRFIDDAQYASDFTSQASRTKSKRVIKQLLLQKGISRDTVESTLEASLGDDTALALLVARRTRGGDLRDPAFYSRQVRYLLGKGFDYDEIICALNCARDSMEDGLSTQD